MVHAIVEGLEVGDYIPGQRLVETELCARFGVGRQTVRDALQQLQVRGVVSITPNRGATLVTLTPQQGADTLKVTQLLFGLAAESAAREIADGASSDRLSRATAELERLQNSTSPRDFVTARRKFYSALAATANNDELSHLLARVRVHVLRAQYGFLRLRGQHASELIAVGKKVLQGDPVGAGKLSREHVCKLQETLKEYEKGV
ncbi:GntR family transcriptional regulator [Hyphomonas adhaerens MHS-3]|uniref:GntR family transcriptional regulator n=2 Tax=Hyphomonas adhaerens TaxID=81029 RepID=A0A069E7D2_9PROT|nr:GntR family transcriptional regulator [Hyphomonas adhaerens MHS-3]